MAQRDYKIDLSASTFPMMYDLQTRTIIGNTSTGGSDRGTSTPVPKYESPGISYCHNVMPTKYGYESVGFFEVVHAAKLIPGITLDDILVIYGSNRTRFNIAFATSGDVFILEYPSYIWRQLKRTNPTFISYEFSIERVTTGVVNGVSYIFVRNAGCFVYDEVTRQLRHVTMVGLNEDLVKGIVGSSGYLIAYSDNEWAWSSTLDPLDFVPSAVTGAGGGDIADIEGNIIFCVPNSMGVLIYSRANVVAATYTGNVAFPFKFREVSGSKGANLLVTTAYESNSQDQYVYTKGGMQAINSQSATTILPEVTDFLAGRIIEDFNTETREFEYSEVPPESTLQKGVKYIASRYLVISYGILGYTHALIYDTGLNKLGKIKLNHTDVFEYVGNQTEISKESLAFLLGDGTVLAVNFTPTAKSDGLLILSKLQYQRNVGLELHELEVENVELDAELTVYDMISLDGKTISSIVDASPVVTEDGYRSYAFRAYGKNHSLVFDGQFDFVTAQIRYVAMGDR